MEEGHAYRCFCSAERLTALRESQAAAGLPTVYDRTCASLSKTDADARAAAGESHVVRMRVPSGSSVVQDAVLGEVTFPHAAIDDQVLLKSDGWPTYHLACVVDDADMGISHVIRGQEWLSSTPKHQLLHAALGSACPQWVHLPLLVNPDRTKLSKRQGHVSVGDFKAAGASPEALVNFVALLGWHPGGGDTTEVMDLQQLQESFATEGLNKANCVVDRTKLAWFNAQHLRRHVARSPVSLHDMVQWMHGRAEAPAAAGACSPFAIAATSAMPAIVAQVQTSLSEGVASELSPLAEAETAGMRAVQASALPELAAQGALHPEHWVSSGAGWCVRWGVLHAALLLQHERVGMYPDYAQLCWPLFARPNAQHEAVLSALPVGSAECLPAVAAELARQWQALPAEAWGELGVPQVMAAFKATCGSTGHKMGMVMKPSRVLLTAADRGVAMNDLLGFLGQEEATLRVAAAR